MDSLVYLGPRDERLNKLLEKIGYDLRVGDEKAAVQEILSGRIVDLIIVDSRLDNGALDLLEYLRNDDLTKQTPIVYLSSSREYLEALHSSGISGVESMSLPVSPGLLAGRVATQLRLRKNRGKEATDASLAEVNSALRDMNSRLQKEREEARTIQQSLLPETLPSDPRYDMAASYDPLEEVGGDWYYAQKVDGDKVSLLVADVTGHGISAAFIGSMTKLALSAAHESDPAKLLAAMNSLMTPQLPPGRFVTMDAVLYDPATGQLSVSQGGHPPVVWVRKKLNEVRTVGATGFGIGFVADAEYQSETVTLEPGDAAFLLTDGITEAQNRAGKMYGWERAAKVALQQDENATTAMLIKAVLEDLSVFCDGRILKDDVTVLGLRRKS